MSDRENCFSTAIRLLARHDAGNDQVTGETLLSLLRLLERNELQHSQDYAALDALTRKLTSLVAHIAEYTIANDEPRQLGASPQASSDGSTSDGEAMAMIERDARAANSSAAPRRAVGRLASSIVVVDDADERQPVKRSFVDVVAEISRRREAQASELFDSSVTCLNAVRSKPDEYRIEAEEAPTALSLESEKRDWREETTAEDEAADELALQRMVDQIDRITAELEQSERVLAALPELVESVDELVAEIDEAELSSVGARDGEHGSERQLARPAAIAASDIAPARAAKSHPDLTRGALRSVPSVDKTEARPPAPARPESVVAGREAKAPTAMGRNPKAARAAARREINGPERGRFLKRVNDKLSSRRWRPLAGACALFVAANVAMAFEVANSRMEPVAVVGEAQAAVPMLAAASGAMPASDLLSPEQVTRTPGALVMPTLVAQHEAAAAQTAVGSAGRATAVSSRAIADYQLGMRYIEGRFSPQNMNEAACLFERAAANGLPPAQYRLGLLLERGLGTPKNLTRAKNLYRRAAEAGHVRAMHNLAVLLSESSAPDAYKNAAVWFERAAQFGVADSQYNLGVLYSRGLGVTRSASQAYRWFGIAAKQGDPGARRERDAIGATLSAADLAAAKVQIAAFVARPPAQGANAVPSDDVGAGGAKLRKIDISIAEPCLGASEASLRVSMK